MEIEDPAHYDLVIQHGICRDEQIVSIIKSSLKYKKIPSRRKTDLLPDAENRRADRKRFAQKGEH